MRMGSKSWADLRVNSPALMNPKKPMQQAAHSMMQSASAELDTQTAFMDLSIDGVIGRRGRAGGRGALLIPLSTYCKRGKAPGVNRSPYPAVI